jgi:carbonic anhydrase
MDTIRTAYQSSNEDIRDAMTTIKNHGTQQQRSDNPQEETNVLQQVSSIVSTTMEEQTNIFHAVQTFFDTIPLINIEYQTTYLEIPFLYKRDLGRYKAYLQQWIQRNETILQAWKDIKVESDQYDDIIDARDNEDEINNLEEAIDKMNVIINNSKRNYAIILAYEQLPDKLSAWVHASDQYVVELISFVNSFIDQTT